MSHNDVPEQATRIIDKEQAINRLQAENEQLRADLRDREITQPEQNAHEAAIIAELQNERNELTYKLTRLEAERNVLREILFDVQEQLFKLAATPMAVIKNDAEW